MQIGLEFAVLLQHVLTCRHAHCPSPYAQHIISLVMGCHNYKSISQVYTPGLGYIPDGTIMTIRSMIIPPIRHILILEMVSEAQSLDENGGGLLEVFVKHGLSDSVGSTAETLS